MLSKFLAYLRFLLRGAVFHTAYCTVARLQGKIFGPFENFGLATLLHSLTPHLTVSDCGDQLDESDLVR